MTRSKLYKPILLLLAALLLIGVSRMQTSLNRDRDRLELTRVTPLENAPPVLAFTTVALGGFRGLIANALWIRMSELQENDKYFEMVQLADWITKLEPHFVQVWTVQAWNLAYNVSVKFPDPEDRWRWVQRGIELLRDDGIRYNPHETLLYRELAWFFQHKMGHNLDDAHMHYKRQWSREMTAVLGARPDYDELLDPQTDEARERVRILRERYKMDPVVMKEVDDLYGPLEWRLPDAHAIYWAEMGRRLAKEKDQDTLRRVIFQTMQMAFMRGGFYEDPFSEDFDLGPNLDIVANVNRAYEQMIEESEELGDHFTTGHRNFIRTAVYFLYTQNRRAQAQRWFTYLKEKYPESIAANLSLDDYALDRITEDVGETDVNRVTAIIEGLLASSFIEFAIDEDERAVNFERTARLLWNRFQKSIEGAEQRVGLEPLPRIKQRVRDRLLDPEHGLPPEFAARLRTKLGLPAPAATPDRAAAVQNGR